LFLFLEIFVIMGTEAITAGCPVRYPLTVRDGLATIRAGFFFAAADAFLTVFFTVAIFHLWLLKKKQPP
jgi:hypothetical protein